MLYKTFNLGKWDLYVSSASTISGSYVTFVNGTSTYVSTIKNKVQQYLLYNVGEGGRADTSKFCPERDNTFLRHC